MSTVNEILLAFGPALAGALLSFVFGWFFAKKASKQEAEHKQKIINDFSKKFSLITSFIMNSSTSIIGHSSGGYERLLQSGETRKVGMYFNQEHEKVSSLVQLLDDGTENTITKEDWNRQLNLLDKISNYWYIIFESGIINVTDKHIRNMPYSDLYDLRGDIKAKGDK